MFASLAIAASIVGTGPVTVAEWRTACAGKDGWSDPAPPLHIFANVYDVGTCGITALLITSDDGHVLLDAATAEAAPSIAANIQRLGFKLGDVKLIGGSHEHLDHVGGIAELQRLTGATVMTVPAAFVAYESGEVDKADPQVGLHEPFPGSKVGRMLFDGEPVRLGPLKITPHATPGHAPGSTSWSWRSCEGEGRAKRCLDIVYADSVSALSGDAYRFRDHDRYVDAFRDSLRKIDRLDCDLLITPHPGASNFIDRLEGKAPLLDHNACKTYAANGRKALDERLAREKGK